MLYRLSNAGFDAYLVGGGVRDLLLGRTPKDFDVATNARPEQVRQVFRNCRLVGRRFVLAHVHFGQEIVEVATFRAAHHEADEGEGLMENGRIVRDNVYGTLEQDALRRDFTVNALYYNIRDFSVVDYSTGMADLHSGILRLMGDPVNRYREDPVRMLRAVRFIAKLGFTIHSGTESPIATMGHLLEDIPPARLFDEALKLLLAGFGQRAFTLLRHYGLFRHLFPQTEAGLVHGGEYALNFLSQALQDTDQRLAQGKSAAPAFLFAALLWEPVRHLAKRLQRDGLTEHDAFQRAGDQIVTRQANHVALPRRHIIQTQEIWTLQFRLENTRGKRALRLLEHPRFRAAYDFLLLRKAGGEAIAGQCDYWTKRWEERWPQEKSL